MKIITIHRSDNKDEQLNVHSDELKTYIDQHSKHFDEKSLGFALSHMVNSNGSDHKFTTEFIQQYLNDNGIHIGNNSNIYMILHILQIWLMLTFIQIYFTMKLNV